MSKATPHSDVQETNVLETSAPSAVSSNASMGILPEMLLMTCQVLVKAPDGSKVKARALLDSASTSSFISERLVQGLGIPRSRQRITVYSVAGLSGSSPFKSVATIDILPTNSTHVVQLPVVAVVVPRVNCDLPLNPVYSKSDWAHIDGIPLADPLYDTPDISTYFLVLMSTYNRCLTAGGMVRLIRPLPLKLYLAGSSWKDSISTALTCHVSSCDHRSGG